MIVELLCSPFFFFINGITALIPALQSIPDYIVEVIVLIKKAMLFFPTDIWILVIGNILYWIVLHFIISLIKFVLGLIPFVNMGS